MEWLSDLIKNNPKLAIVFPTVLSCISFFGNLASALSDGVIDDNEMHQLLSSANGLESLILIGILLALRNKKD